VPPLFPISHLSEFFLQFFLRNHEFYIHLITQPRTACNTFLKIIFPAASLAVLAVNAGAQGKREALMDKFRLYV
jgi:hypothetical protein